MVDTLIVTHVTADFDGLACAVAAQKLYPGSAILLDAGVGRDVHGYLALHRDRFRTVGRKDVDFAALSRLVLVDVRRRSRLKAVSTLLARDDLEVHIFDHHRASDDDVLGDVEVIAPVGSATTLFVERFRDGDVALDVTEATLFLLGIYADTACLTTGNTTGRDAAAAAWLIDRGVQMNVVNRYLRRAFSDAQRDVLTRLLQRGAIHTERVHGLRVGLATIALEKTVNGLADVTSAALELEPLDALLALYLIAGKRIEVVGRALSPLINIGDAIESVGGGGHAAAGSAHISSADVGAARGALLAALRAQPAHAARVVDVMSSPVHSVAPDTRLGELSAALATWRHTGAPVLADGELVGIVSWRDLAAAARRGHLDRPVSSCMTRVGLVTVAPDTPLDEALDLMTASNVGRLPVLRYGKLIGIVTRSDALRVLYGSADSDDEGR